MWAPVCTALHRRISVQLICTPATSWACRMYSSAKQADHTKLKKDDNEDSSKREKKEKKKKKNQDEEEIKVKEITKKETTKMILGGENTKNEPERSGVGLRRTVRSDSGHRLSAVQRHKFVRILETLNVYKETPVSIYLDSDANSGINIWPVRWMKRGWRTMIDTEVCNKDIIYQIIYELASRTHPVKWATLPHKDFFTIEETDLQDERAEIKVGDAVDYEMPAFVPEPGFYQIYATELKEMEKREAKEKELQQKRDEETGIIPKVEEGERGKIVLIKKKKTVKGKISAKKVKVKITKEKKKIVVKSKPGKTKKGDKKGKDGKKEKKVAAV